MRCFCASWFASLYVCSVACLLARSLACSLACLRACVLACLLACLLVCLLGWLFACLLGCLLVALVCICFVKCLGSACSCVALLCRGGGGWGIVGVVSLGFRFSALVGTLGGVARELCCWLGRFGFGATFWCGGWLVGRCELPNITLHRAKPSGQTAGTTCWRAAVGKHSSGFGACVLVVTFGRWVARKINVVRGFLLVLYLSFSAIRFCLGRRGGGNTKAPGGDDRPSHPQGEKNMGKWIIVRGSLLGLWGSWQKTATRLNPNQQSNLTTIPELMIRPDTVLIPSTPDSNPKGSACFLGCLSHVSKRSLNFFKCNGEGIESTMRKI